MQLYADEDFPFPAVVVLRHLGHDVLTAKEDGRLATPDPDILARAHALKRAVLTQNRRGYEGLHRQGALHSGILSTTHDPNNPNALAARVHATLSGRSLGRWCILVNRRPSP